MDRRLPDGLEQRSFGAACDRAHRNRGIGGSECRGADGGDLGAQRLGQQRQTIDVRGLALIGRHTQRRVTLGVFDRFVPLACGQPDVCGGHIILEVDEVFGSVRILTRRGGEPVGLHRRCIIRPEIAIGGAHAARHRLPIGAQRRLVRVRAEVGVLGIPCQLATAMGPKVHNRGPTTGIGD